MFGLFKAKPARAVPVAPVAPAPALDPSLPALMLQAMLGALVRGGRFQGGCDQLPGWEAQTMPEGIQVGRCRKHLAGAVMAETSVAMMFAGLDAGRNAMVYVGAICRHLLQVEPRWSQDAEGAWVASMPFGFAPGWTADLVLKDTDVDPLFAGKTLPGLQMDLTVRKA
jgi:hypothetical protein